MSSEQNSEPMGVPHNADGEPDLAQVVRGIFRDAQWAPEGKRIAFVGRLDDDDPPISFSAVYDGHGGVIVSKACLTSRFNASLYLALEAESPALVRSADVNPFTTPSAGEV